MKNVKRVWLQVSMVAALGVASVSPAPAQTVVLREAFERAVSGAARAEAGAAERALAREAMRRAEINVARELEAQAARRATAEQARVVEQKLLRQAEANQAALRAAEEATARRAAEQARAAAAAMPPPSIAPAFKAAATGERVATTAVVDTRGLGMARDDMRRVFGQVRGSARSEVGAAIRKADDQLAIASAQARRGPPNMRGAFEDVRDPHVVYVRTHPNGDSYVGRSRSSSTYMGRQAAHDATPGLLKPGDRNPANRYYPGHRYEVIATAKTKAAAQVAEETAIRQRGGPIRKGVRNKLLNKRVEMSETRYRDAGGTEPLPAPPKPPVPEPHR